MAIANDFFVDYQNKLVVHATYSLAFNAGDVEILPGNTIGNLSTNPTKTAVVVAVTVSSGSWTGNDAAGTLDLVYITGSWIANDDIYVGAAKYAESNGTPTAKTTVYTVRALYSFIQNTFDELGQMDDTVPMSAQTPTEFTMINGWFIDDESTKYLSGGAISTSGYNNEIRILTLAAGGYTSAVVTDIGKIVVGGTTTDSGKLLHYNNTTRKWWVRMDRLRRPCSITPPKPLPFPPRPIMVPVPALVAMSAVSRTGEDFTPTSTL